MGKMKIFFGRVGILLYMGLRIYSIWSHIYRFFREQRFKFVELSKFATLEEAHEKVMKLKWTSDSWEQLGDAVSCPEKVEVIVSGIEPQPEHGTDCDEFAIYLTNTIDNSLVDPEVPLQASEPDLWEATMMSVMWVDKDGKYGGHNVCLLEYRHDEWSKWRYMDYGMPSRVMYSTGGIASIVIDRYAPGGTLLAYAIHSKNMWTRVVRLG